MTTLGESARAYEPKQTKNIVDLQIVKVDSELHEGSAMDNEGKEFTYNYILVEGEEYRVPNSVLKDLKVILESNPNLKTFQVRKQGTGFNTKYTVIPLG